MSHVSASEPIEPTGRALKSAHTRARLVEATIRCLVKYGYAKTTTAKVAEEAGLSRGAMLHHFESGRQLMLATLVELHQKRLRAFRRSTQSNRQSVQTLTRAYWKQLLRPTFTAFQELAMAARTDAQLAAVLGPVQEEFRARWQALALELFPEWAPEPDRFRLALATTQHLVEGLAVNQLTRGVSETEAERVIAHLEAQIAEMRRGSGSGDRRD